MKEPLIIICAWLFFGGAHLLLSWPPVREKLVSRFGMEDFTKLYGVIAAVTLLLLAAAIAHYGNDGASGPNLAIYPVVGYVLGGVSFFGAALMIAGLLGYSGSPMAILPKRMRGSGDTGKEALSKPVGVSRLSRHPFFVGLIFMMSVHTLLASTAAMSIFFGGFALLGILGIPMQDRKLAKLHGKIYEDYLGETTVIPLPKSSIEPKPQAVNGWKPLVIALIAAFILLKLHILWKPTNGAAFAVLVAIGGSVTTILALRK